MHIRLTKKKPNFKHVLNMLKEILQRVLRNFELKFVTLRMHLHKPRHPFPRYWKQYQNKMPDFSSYGKQFFLSTPLPLSGEKKWILISSGVQYQHWLSIENKSQIPQRRLINPFPNLPKTRSYVWEMSTSLTKEDCGDNYDIRGGVMLRDRRKHSNRKWTLMR